MELPVALTGDRDVGEFTLVELRVGTAKNQLTSLLSIGIPGNGQKRRISEKNTHRASNFNYLVITNLFK